MLKFEVESDKMMCTTCIALLMEYATFVKFKHDRKDVDRTLRVPIPDSISILLVLPPSLLGILLLLSVSSWMTYACIICVFALCCGMVFLQRIFKERDWCQFEEPTQPLLALLDSAHVLDYESPDISTVEDSNDDCISIFEIANEKAKLGPVLSHISTCTCSEMI